MVSISVEWPIIQSRLMKPFLKQRLLQLGLPQFFLKKFSTAITPPTWRTSLERIASARAATILSKEVLQVGGVIAVVEGERCAACLTCVRVCPYEVPVINAKGEAEIDLAKCKGCGRCVGGGPARAIELMHFRDRQLQAKGQALGHEIAAEE